MAELRRSLRLPKIGFTGPSGAGKTTQCEYFGRNTGFIALEGDEIMFKAFAEDPELAKKIFGRALEPGENEKEFAYSNYLPLTPEKERAIFESTRGYVEKQLEWAFQNPTTDFGSHDILKNAVLFQPKNSNGSTFMPNGIALEMCGYHRTDRLKRGTDFTVLVDSDKKLRRNMLIKRPNMQEFVKRGNFNEVLAIREMVQGEFLEGLETSPQFVKRGLTLVNNYDDKSLKLGQQKIVAAMKDRGIEI